MNHEIEYAVLCNKGKVRDKNQDNFWCIGSYLEAENEGLKEVYSKVVRVSASPAFVVFDGLGGEQQGEVAAYIAANEFDTLYINNSKENLKQFLLDSCMTMNQKICEYASEQCIQRIGTTVAMLMFDSKSIHVCNVGDSRVYQFRDNNLTQLSYDHLATYLKKKKLPLTQNLGIPEEEFLIEPFITKNEYRKGDRFLVCSDGLTDMIHDEEISFLLGSRCIRVATERLMKLALKRGGVDNITIIVCEVR